MNKASEWVERSARAGPRPTFETSIVSVARVLDDGRISVTGIFSHEEGRRLAAWILDITQERGT